MGNEKASVPRSHGNSLIQSYFFRTRPSVVEKLKEKCQEKELNIVYKEEIANTDHTDVVSEAVSKSRNRKQLENLRSSMKNETRLSRDAVLSAHELAYELTDFVHYFATVPYLVVVIGKKELFQELELLYSQETRLSYCHMIQPFKLVHTTGIYLFCFFAAYFF